MKNHRLISRLLLVAALVVLVAVPGHARTYTMVEGDTLWELANKFYGDPTVYPVFLEVNSIDNPRTIPVGRVINVPSYDEMRRIANEVNPEKRAQLINQIRGGGTPDKPNTGSGSGSGSAIQAKNLNFDKVINSKVNPTDLEKNKDAKPFTKVEPGR